MSFNSKYTGAQVEAWLDNIKNYSANDILEKLKTVDGSNSGLDADLLDGKQPSELNVSSATKLQTARTIWGQSFDGTGNVSGNVKGSYFTIEDRDNAYIELLGGTNYGYVQILADGSMAVGSNTSSSIIVNKNGNVGIGTTSPNQKLHVEGGVRVNGQIIGADSIVSNTTNGYFVGNRNDGLGVTDGGLLLYTYGKTPISFYVNGERMRINASGNVGIGTTNPSYKLDVNGTFNAISIKENGTDISSTYLKKNKNTLIIGGQQRVDITPYYDTSSGMKVALVTLVYGNYSCVFLVYSNGTTFHRISTLENAANVLNLEISEGKLTVYNKATSSYTVPITIIYLS